MKKYNCELKWGLILSLSTVKIRVQQLSKTPKHRKLLQQNNGHLTIQQIMGTVPSAILSSHFEESDVFLFIQT